MRLPSDIIQNGSGWRYVLDRASGLSTQIDFPQLNFGSHYFLFSYSLGRSGTSWAMADLDTGEISREPDRVFGYSEGHSEPVGVPDRNGKFHSCRYEFRLISEPYSDVVTAERRLAGEAGDDGMSDGSVCMGNECWSRRYALRDGKFVPENPDDGGFAAGTDAGFPHTPAGLSECAYATGKWLVKSSSRRRFRRGGERFLSDGAAARREIVRQCSLWERNE